MEKQSKSDLELQKYEETMRDQDRKRRLELLEAYKKTSHINDDTNDDIGAIYQKNDANITELNLLSESKEDPSKNTYVASKSNELQNKRRKIDTSSSESDSSDNDSDELDMFASDDEFEKQINKLKENQKIEKVVQDTEQTNNSNLIDNWNDEEGYYKFNIGEIFASKYQIINENGKGVFSSVLVCTNIQTQEKVAIKVIRNKEKMREEGRKEIEILQELKEKKSSSHTHCISILDNFVYRNHLCIVFPYMSMNLRDCLHKYGVNVGLNFKAVKSFAHQLFISLLHTSSLYIIHADIKPDNVLIKKLPGTEIYLSDFGSAFHVYDTTNIPTPYLVSRFYRAPEIILGFKPTPAVDVWSIGCVLIELFTGKPLFIGNNNNEMIQYMQDYKGPFPHKMIKKHISTYTILGREPIFNENYEFLQITEDPITHQSIIKTDLYTTVRKPLEKVIMASKHTDDSKQELKEFVEFLEKCFILDPEKRLTPKQAFEQPYLKRQL